MAIGGRAREGPYVPGHFSLALLGELHKETWDYFQLVLALQTPETSPSPWRVNFPKTKIQNNLGFEILVVMILNFSFSIL